MAEISAAVGLGGRNVPVDVTLVQSLLSAKGLWATRATGACDSHTIEAIKVFQHSFMHAPDGRIDVGGKTWNKLSDGASAPGATRVYRVDDEPVRSTAGEGDYDQAGKPLTNPRLKRNVSTINVGPFRATGLTPAVLSLRLVMADVQRLQPDLYSILSSAGMLVVRFVRGSTKSISNHSWGTAIDLKIGGKLDTRGDNQVQYGMTLLARIFNARGWFWGAGFRTEDAMHFEAGRDFVQRWVAQVV